MSINVLVTGGTGFLGSHLVRRLIQEGCKVRVLHRPSSDLKLLQSVPFESFVGDVTDLQSVMAACEGMKLVFHAASLVSYDGRQRSQMYATNVEGTKNILKACMAAKVKKLIYTSSVVAIGASQSSRVLDENSPFELNPVNLGYYQTKKYAEGLVMERAQRGDIDAVVVNPAVVFGPGDGLKGSRKIHMFVAAGRFPFYPPGALNVVGIDDVITGHWLASQKGRSGERYILSGENVSNKELFGWLAKAGGHRAPNIPLPRFLLRAVFYLSRLFGRALDSAYAATLYHWYDCSKAKDELGYRPTPAYPWVVRSIAWCKKERLIK